MNVPDRPTNTPAQPSDSDSPTAAYVFADVGDLELNLELVKEIEFDRASLADAVQIGREMAQRQAVTALSGRSYDEHQDLDPDADDVDSEEQAPLAADLVVDSALTGQSLVAGTNSILSLTSQPLTADERRSVAGVVAANAKLRRTQQRNKLESLRRYLANSTDFAGAAGAPATSRLGKAAAAWRRLLEGTAARLAAVVRPAVDNTGGRPASVSGGGVLPRAPLRAVFAAVAIVAITIAAVGHGVLRQEVPATGQAAAGQGRDQRDANAARQALVLKMIAPSSGAVAGYSVAAPAASAASAASATARDEVRTVANEPQRSPSSANERSASGTPSSKAHATSSLPNSLRPLAVASLAPVGSASAAASGAPIVVNELAAIQSPGLALKASPALAGEIGEALAAYAREQPGDQIAQVLAGNGVAHGRSVNGADEGPGRGPEESSVAAPVVAVVIAVPAGDASSAAALRARVREFVRAASVGLAASEPGGAALKSDYLRDRPQEAFLRGFAAGLRSSPDSASDRASIDRLAAKAAGIVPADSLTVESGQAVIQPLLLVGNRGEPAEMFAAKLVDNLLKTDSSAGSVVASAKSSSGWLGVGQRSSGDCDTSGVMTKKVVGARKLEPERPCLLKPGASVPFGDVAKSFAEPTSRAGEWGMVKSRAEMRVSPGEAP